MADNTTSMDGLGFIVWATANVTPAEPEPEVEVVAAEVDPGPTDELQLNLDLDDLVDSVIDVQDESVEDND